MPFYISLINFTDQGLKDIKNVPGRIAAARNDAAELGGSIDQVFLTMGAYDVITISEFPDDVTASTFVLKIAKKGNIRSQTLKAFNEDALDIIVNAV